MRHMADEGFGPAPFGDVVGDLEKATDAAGVVAHRGDRDVDRYARAVAMHVRPFAFVGRRVAAGRDDHLAVGRNAQAGLTRKFFGAALDRKSTRLNSSP